MPGRIALSEEVQALLMAHSIPSATSRTAYLNFKCDSVFVVKEGGVGIGKKIRRALGAARRESALAFAQDGTDFERVLNESGYEEVRPKIIGPLRDAIRM
jgi:hypothetical protein